MKERKGLPAYLAALTIGLLGGGLLGELVGHFLPPGVVKEFFLTGVRGELGPVSVDLAVVAVTLGPIALKLNILSLVGLVGAAYLFRSFF